MKLYIDTSDSIKTVVGLDGKHWTFSTKEHKSQQLLGLLHRLQVPIAISGRSSRRKSRVAQPRMKPKASLKQILKKHQKTLGDLSEIEINLGPGSFTGLKVGVAVANALGWALKIPINGKKVGELVEPKYK